MHVQGEGSQFAWLVFITDLPEEWDALTPFLNGTDLPPRNQIFLTTLMTEADWPELETELNIVRPDILVTFGPEVSRAFLGEVDMESTYGRPYQVGCFVVFPAHAPIEEVEFACDLLRLSLYLQPQPRPAEVPAPAPRLPAPAPQTPRQNRFDL